MGYKGSAISVASSLQPSEGDGKVKGITFFEKIGEWNGGVIGTGE